MVGPEKAAVAETIRARTIAVAESPISSRLSCCRVAAEAQKAMARSPAENPTRYMLRFFGEAVGDPSGSSHFIRLSGFAGWIRVALRHASGTRCLSRGFRRRERPGSERAGRGGRG